MAFGSRNLLLRVGRLDLFVCAGDERALAGADERVVQGWKWWAGSSSPRRYRKGNCIEAYMTGDRENAVGLWRVVRRAAHAQ